MILADTSVWIDFLRGATRVRPLAVLLAENRIIMHDWVRGELMLGHLGPRRDRVLADLEQLPHCALATMAEMTAFLGDQRLAGRGLSLVDLQLLCAAVLEDVALWTHDRQLREAAHRCGRSFGPS